MLGGQTCDVTLNGLLCLALVIPSVWCGTAGVSLVFHLKAFNSTTIVFLFISGIFSSVVA